MDAKVRFSKPLLCNCEICFPIAVHLARGTRIALAATAVLASIYRFKSVKRKIVALTESIRCKDEKWRIKSYYPFTVSVCPRLVKLRPNPNLKIRLVINLKLVTEPLTEFSEKGYTE